MTSLSWLALFLGFAATAQLYVYGRSIDQVIQDAATDQHAFDFLQDNDTSVLVELDMKFTPEQWEEIQRSRIEEDNGRSRRKAVSNTRLRWTNKIVPYTIQSGFSSSDRQQIQYAIDDWQRNTCLRFKPRTNERNYVAIVDGGGCSSYVGMIGGAQRLTLARGCRTKSVIVHELGHAIGFHHEQTRPDRDSYVTIHYNNIQRGMEFNFQKYSTSTINSRGVSYDYPSIMHYGAYAFSSNGRPTITTKDSYWQNRIGKGSGLSQKDIQLARIIYSC